MAGVARIQTFFADCGSGAGNGCTAITWSSVVDWDVYYLVIEIGYGGFEKFFV